MEKFENKKYEMLMDEANTIQWKGHTLHRIKALKDFDGLKKVIQADLLKVYSIYQKKEIVGLIIMQRLAVMLKYWIMQKYMMRLKYLEMQKLMGQLLFVITR